MTDKKLTPAEIEAAATADAALAREALKAEVKAELEAERRAAEAVLIEEAKADVANMTGEGVKLETGGSLLVRIVKGDKKLAKSCPKEQVAMRALGTRRVACTSGSVYLFHADGIEFINKADRDECAAAGAVDVQ